MGSRGPIAALLVTVVVAAVAGGLLSDGLAPEPPNATPSHEASPAVVAVDLAAVADTYVNRAQPTASYGNSELLIATNNPSWGKWMLVAFDPSRLPAGAIVGAELVLTGDSNQARGVIVHETTSAWSESTTWDSRPSLGPAVGAASHPRGGPAAVVRLGAQRGGDGWWAFAVTSPTTDAPVRVWSRDSGTQGPRLRVSVDPSAGPSAARDKMCDQAGVTLSPSLVPSCGTLLGVVANAFSQRAGWPAQGPDAHRRFEAEFDHTFGVYSHYYSGAAVFPSDAEIALSRQQGIRRLIYIHWKIADGMTFADVAAGRADARIDREAAHLKTRYPDRFFVSIQSEMEPQIDPDPGSGRTAQDYAAMYRHVVNRMRTNGVGNVIWVLAYGGNARWATSKWFPDLYPGDEFVDWIAWHPYSTTLRGGPDFTGLMNSTTGSADPTYPGMYDYLTRRHPGKPLMLSEFGVFHDPAEPRAELIRKAGFYDSVRRQLPRFPAIKAIVNFDTDNDQHLGNGYDISVLSHQDNRAAFARLARNPQFVDPPEHVGAAP